MRITPFSAISNREKCCAVWGLLLVVLGSIFVWRLSPQAPPVSAKDSHKVNARDGLTYIWISPGSFMMGCSPGDKDCLESEKPAHKVRLTKGFWIGATEVTVSAYRRFAASTKVQMPVAPTFNADWEHQNMPIVNVTWDNAAQFCRWAGGRQPTEAEWEYAARAGSNESGNRPIDELAWYLNNSGGKPHEVGNKRPNDWGLYDMLGNVWEWVYDWYAENYYAISPMRDPSGPATGNTHVLRGGSWATYARSIRVSRRGKSVLADGNLYGFRCARE